MKLTKDQIKELRSGRYCLVKVQGEKYLYFMKVNKDEPEVLVLYDNGSEIRILFENLTQKNGWYNYFNPEVDLKEKFYILK